MTQTVVVVVSSEVYIPEDDRLAAAVEHDDRYGIVLVDDLEHEVEIGILIGIVECAHGLCPHFHLLAFLYG